jgi:hypothetical protein
MDLIAYALRSDLEGTVDVELADGTQETRPKFGGGVLAVGDGDFHVADTLEAGGGTIVIRAHDQQLADVLDAYPALKRVAAPENPAAIVSPYERRSTDALRHLVSLRDADGEGSSRAALIERLEYQDAVNYGYTSPAAPDDGLDGLLKADLLRLGETNDVDLSEATTNDQRVAALRAAGVTATPEA